MYGNRDLLGSRLLLINEGDCLAIISSGHSIALCAVHLGPDIGIGDLLLIGLCCKVRSTRSREFLCLILLQAIGQITQLPDLVSVRVFCNCVQGDGGLLRLCGPEAEGHVCAALEYGFCILYTRELSVREGVTSNFSADKLVVRVAGHTGFDGDVVIAEL